MTFIFSDTKNFSRAVPNVPVIKEAKIHSIVSLKANKQWRCSECIKANCMRLLKPLKPAMKITEHTKCGLIPGAQTTGSGIPSSGCAPDAETRSDNMTTKKGMHSVIVAGRLFSRRR
jgi:hypothetical protein